jgi:hypothetical protein
MQPPPGLHVAGIRGDLATGRGREAMTTIYLATAGEYSDFRVCHAFSSREDAESYKLGDDVKEMEVHDGPVEVRRWYRLCWFADQPDRRSGDGLISSNPVIHDDERRDFDGDPRHAEHQWDDSLGRNILTVEGWDRALVKKVYGEQRAQYLARQEGVS